MLAQNFSCQADCLIRSKSSVCEYIQCQLIKVGNLAHTGILNGHIDTLYRCVDGIHSDHSDWKLVVLVLVCADITTAFCDVQFHIELTVRAAA